MRVDLSTISSALRRGRLAKRITQVDLAQRLGVTQGTISRAEGGRDLRLSTLVELARSLDLELLLVPRRLQPVVESLVGGTARNDTTAIYTGLGEEPYDEGDSGAISP